MKNSFSAELVSPALGEPQSGEKNFLSNILKSKITFSAELQVSPRSKYGDSIWSWEDSFNPRLKMQTKSYLRIDWEGFLANNNLTVKMVEDLKKYLYFRCYCSKIMFDRTRRNVHPQVAIREVKLLCKFFSYIRSELSFGNESLINTLSDIEVQDLRDYISTAPGAKDKLLVTSLRNLSSETFGRHLDCEKIKWNANDIKTLNWQKRKTKPYERLPDGLFSELSNAATIDVKHFLKALKMNVEDETLIDQGLNTYLEFFDNFDEVFSWYAKYKPIPYEGHKYSSFYADFRRTFRKPLGFLVDLIERASIAAQIILMMYTGARISEFSGFKIGCLHKREDTWVIAGTVIKHFDLDKPIDQDEWVAIPIIRDAVRLLEKVAVLTGAKLLFHPTVASGDPDKFLSTHTVSRRVRRYLNIIDGAGKWAGISVHSHQFRHSLVFELRKAELGLPFITHQLKHHYNYTSRSVNNMTLNYGNIGTEGVKKAIEDANTAAIYEMYHPDSPVAGGGAVQHRKRRDAYFLGAVHSGMTIDDALRRLIKEGRLPFIDVGLGYCQGKSKIDVDGVQSDPPCIGSLSCNPVNCSNAVIPRHKLPNWERSLIENKERADDPEFAHAKSSFTKAVKEAESVIKIFRSKERSR